jgi:beta-phosphoglucomutase-like phosphatase (HAD superfamily)
VFDMDGLLVDSEPLWVLAEAELLARHGDHFTPADAEATHGRSIDDTIAAYVRRLGGADPAALRFELIALMRSHYSEGLPVRPGARELVRSLEGRVPLAVASNTDGDLVRLALEKTGLLDAFAAIASGADLARAKPHRTYTSRLAMRSVWSRATRSRSRIRRCAGRQGRRADLYRRPGP